MANSSKTALTALASELGLADLLPNMKDHGWETFGDFAFATSDPEGKNHDLFQTQVVDILLATDGSQKALVPRLRRLYAQSYMVASQAMAEFANPQGATEKTHMLTVDRTARTKDLKEKIIGFEMAGPNMPSTALTDRCATILKSGQGQVFAVVQVHVSGRGSLGPA